MKLRTHGGGMRMSKGLSRIIMSAIRVDTTSRSTSNMVKYKETKKNASWTTCNHTSSASHDNKG
jgi:hypothetical protein